MNIAALIGIMIAIVVGVNLITPITEVVNNITQNATQAGGEPTVITSLISILPHIFRIFIAVIILGAVAWIGGTATGRATGRQILERIRLHGILGNLPTDRFTKEWYRDHSTGMGGEELLAKVGVQGVMVSQLVDRNVTGIEPLNLRVQEKKLWIDTNFDWYVMEKDPKFEMYKMVGLHKKQRGLNCIYVVGKDSHTATPYILRCPPEYMKSPIDECIKWNVGIEKGDTLVEV